jgi:hypothetical protein
MARSRAIRFRQRLCACVVTAVATIAGTAVGSSPAGAAVSIVTYNAQSLAQYHQMWSNPYGPLDNATLTMTNGALGISDVPFKSGVDFSVFDHLKYIAISNRSFAMPSRGSLSFAVSIKASTPGAVAGHVVHGQYGPPGSYDPANTTARPYAAAVLEGQQAGVVLNMIDFCTGQLFDWFLSSNYAFALIERLPTSVTGNTSNPGCPNAGFVGLDKAYTQIVRNVRILPGLKHRVQITYTHGASGGSVAYFLDGFQVAAVNNVGVPLDKQGHPYTGIYPSLGPGEPLADQIHSFSIGHGLFSLLDAFPFQYGCTPPTGTGPGVCDPATLPYSVSIPASERAFGQGAVGTFNSFTVTTIGS